MKAKEFDIKKRDPNWRAMQDIRRSGAGGQHKDKKRAAKQGEVKHKGKDVAEGSLNEFSTGGDDGQDPFDAYPCYDCGSTIFLHHTKSCDLAEPNAMRDLPEHPGTQHWTGDIPKGLHPIPGLQEGVAEGHADELYGLRIGDTVTAKIDGQRVQGDIIDIFPDDMEVELLLRGPETGRTVVVDVRDTEIVEATGDEKFDAMMRTIKKGTKKQATADRREREAESRKRARDAFGPSPADRLSIRSNKGVQEGNEPDEKYLDKVISDLHKDAFGARPDHEFGREWMSSSYEEKLRIFKNMLKSLHNGMDEVMAYGTGFGSSSQGASPRRKKNSMLSIMQRMKDKEKKKTPKVGDKIEFGQFNKPESMKKATVVKVGDGGLILTIKTDDGKQGNISLGNKSLALKILEDDGTITQNLPFGSVKLPKPDPVSSRPGLQQRPGSEKEKENMPPKIKRLWDRIKQEPKIWAEVMNIIDEFDTLRDDEIEDEINAFLSSDTLMMRAVGIVLQYEYEKMKNESVREDSDWGEPREILEDVLRTLEREVEWPLTEVMDPKQVRQLLSPIVRAVNDKLLSMDRDGNQ